jgi:hypothetical protein
MDGTPIVDIKPYIPYTDARPEAIGGFTDSVFKNRLHVNAPAEILNKLESEKRDALVAVLEQDPRPAYQDDPERIYGFSFAGKEIKFKVNHDTLELVSID